MEFYSYLWLREDGTPWYAGKGSGKRAYVQHEHFYPPKDRSCILIFPRASEAEAFATEIELIRNWGRLDIGTGCLHNHTDGGENPPSWRGRKRGRQSEEHLHRLMVSRAGRCGGWNKGVSPNPETREKISGTLHGNQNAAGHAVSAESRYLMGNARRGKPSPRKGMKASAETKQKISESGRGRVPWNKDRITSDATKQKQRASALARHAKERESR